METPSGFSKSSFGNIIAGAFDVQLIREQNNRYKYNCNAVWQVTGRIYRTEPQKGAPIVRFIVKDTIDDTLNKNHESKELKWIECIEDIPTNNKSIYRMFSKWKSISSYS